MKKANRILLGIGFALLLLISWMAAASTESPTDKQEALIARADVYLADKVYIRAMPLLEEALGYEGEKSGEAEDRLKQVYIELINKSGVKNKYLELLDRQMSREDTVKEVYLEAVEFYLTANRLPEALEILRNGIQKLGDQELIDRYEAERYAFGISQTSYEEVTDIVNSYIQVRRGDYWGLAGYSGAPVIPCEYEKISSCDYSRAIVMKDGEIYAVDMQNNRLALLHENAIDIGNYGNDRIPILTTDGWRRASGEMTLGSMTFEQIGMYANGYAAAKQSGKWGVIDTADSWILPAEYDEIICDNMGRCYAQNSVFVKKNGKVLLFVSGEQTGNTFDDAKPFTDDGWAAVKLNGKWGFINTAGDFMIEPQFDEALSFSGHLAAVKQGGLWGYAALTGKTAIEPQFVLAKSFANGTAPVIVDGEYRFITLKEYAR